MKREFLQNFKVGDQPLTKEIVDAIMAENGRDIEEAKKPFADYDSIKEQLQTSGVKFKVLLTESAIRADGTCFNDHHVHLMLP